MAVVSVVQTASWYTEQGLKLMHKALRKKGLPDSTNWRMFTLTFDRSLFENREKAYEKGKARLREWLKIMARRVYGLQPKWCWKLEFHGEDEWVHWHVFVGYTRKLTYAQMRIASDAWGLGRVNVRRVPVYHDPLSYAFKYAFKQPSATAAPGEEIYAPDWWLDYQGRKRVKVCGEWKEKPVTAARFRIWQTSREFYTKTEVRQNPKKDPTSQRVVKTLREALEHASRKISVVYEAGERYIGSEVTYWKGTWEEMREFFHPKTFEVLADFAPRSSYRASVDIFAGKTNLKKMRLIRRDRPSRYLRPSFPFSVRLELAPESSLAGALRARMGLAA